MQCHTPARLGAPRALRFESVEPLLDLPGHVRAGSGLRRWGEHLVVVQDDVNALALVDARTALARPLLLPRGPGERRQFSEAEGTKASKMDLEACVVLPDGRLVALGSGSRPLREQLVVVDQERRVRVVDGAELYAHLRATTDFAGSELNLEGAAVSGEALWLFQRGNGAPVDGIAPQSAMGALDLAAFVRWLDGVGPTPELQSVVTVDLGSVRGVPFGFTDATPLPDGRIAFLAGAEASADAYSDGAVVGARIGIADPNAIVVADVVDDTGLPVPWKLEGLDYVGRADTGKLEFLVVTDMDDPDSPAGLASLDWEPA